MTEDGRDLPAGTEIIAVIAETGEEVGNITMDSPGEYGGGGLGDEKLTVDSDIDREIQFVVRNGGETFVANWTDPDPSSGAQEVDLAFPPGAGTSRPYLAVDNLSPGETTAVEGESITTNATIWNAGSEPGTQTVTLWVDGLGKSSRTVSLDAGETTTVEFSLDTTGLDAGEHTYGIATENESASAALDIEAQRTTFTIEGIEPTDISVLDGEPVNVSATLNNTGNAEGTQTVSLSVDDQTVRERDVTLGAGNRTTVNFTAIDTGQFDPGSHTYTVATGNRSESGSLTIEANRTVFSIDDLSPGEQTVLVGAAANVSATVTNTGNRDGTQTVSLSVNGTTAGSREVTLAAGNTTTLSYGIDTEQLGIGTYTYTARTANATANGTLTVRSDARTNFSVSDFVPVETTVSNGTTAAFSATITNVGDRNGSQMVELTVDGAEVGTRLVTLDTGAETTVEIAVDTGTLGPGTYDTAIASTNDSEGGTMTVEGGSSTFTVRDVLPANTTVAPGEIAEFSAAVTNVGDGRTTQSVRVLVAGARFDAQPVTLNASEETTVTLAVDTTSLDPGTYEAVVASEDDTATASLTVDAASGSTPRFTVADLSPENTTAAQGETVQFSAAITNEGDVAGTQQVRLAIGETTATERSVSLGAGETTIVDLSLDTATVTPGTYDTAILTGNDSQQGRLVVEGATPTATDAVTPTATVTNATTPTVTPTPTATNATQPDGGGGGLFGLLQTILLYVGVPVALIYGVLKGMAIYLGY